MLRDKIINISAWDNKEARVTGMKGMHTGSMGENMHRWDGEKP